MPWPWPFRARPIARTEQERKAEQVEGQLDRALAQARRSLAQVQQIADATAQIVERRNGGGAES